jgi:DNA repair photolyase
LTVNEIEVKSLVTKTQVPAADYVINPYIGCPHRCVYCYAEFMRRFTRHTEPWGEFLDVKRCKRPIRAEIRAEKYSGSSIVLSTVTDAYNPFEERYGVTREILASLAGAGAAVTILTKSALVIRDIDLLQRIPGASAGLSLNTLDDGIRKKLEPGASPIPARLAALKALREAGIRNFVFVSPIFPGLTDYRAIIRACMPYTQEFHFENLNLRGGFKRRVLEMIGETAPGLLPLYDDIYRRGDRGYWIALEEEIAAFCKSEGLDFISYFFHEKIKKSR